MTYHSLDSGITLPPPSTVDENMFCKLIEQSLRFWS